MEDAPAWGHGDEIRVAIIAAYPSARAGLRVIVERDPLVRVVFEDDGLPPSEDLGRDIEAVIVDVGDDPGLAIEDIPGPAVMLLSDPGGALDPRPAHAYLAKDATAEEIVAALHAAVHGLAVLDPEVIAMARTRRRGASIGLEQLTDRELDVLRLVATGLTNKAIARQLGISDHTVKFHVGAILAKLGAESRTEAVTIAARSGILPL